ncbi:MAG: rhomboid family intramembrane serine protease [Acidobacteriota bacterium]
MLPRDTIQLRIATLLGFVGLMWFVWLLDWIIPGPGSAAGVGVLPRTWVGLEGIPVAPFIHAGLDHLVANTIPLLVLGALILLRGVAELLFVILVSGLTAGMGTWLFGSSGQHIGASGIVFGFFGYLVFRTAFDRRISSALVTLAVAWGYGTAMAYSLIPTGTISWSGHFFGFVGGFLAARFRYPAQRLSPHTRRGLDEVRFTGRIKE